MKKIKLLSTAALALVVLFSACKKDKDKTTQEKLQAKWNFNKEYSHSYYLGVDSRDTTYGAGDYADFRGDGKVYTKFGTSYDTTNYALLGDDKIIMTYGTSTLYHDTVHIQVLNDNSLQTYSKYYSGVNFDEYTDFYSK
jgi:hypothetical protein